MKHEIPIFDSNLRMEARDTTILDDEIVLRFAADMSYRQGERIDRLVENEVGAGRNVGDGFLLCI